MPSFSSPLCSAAPPAKLLALRSTLLPAVDERDEDLFAAAHALGRVPSPDVSARATAAPAALLPPVAAASQVPASSTGHGHRQHETAILGGSFDPPHWGTAWCVRRLLLEGFRDVWLMPADAHAEKSHLTPFDVRFQMLLSLRDHLCEVTGMQAERITVTNVERFVDSGGQTLDVLREMRTLYPDHHFVLAVGADVGARIDQWPRARVLRREFSIVGLERPGGPWRAELVAKDDKAVLMSSTEVRALRRANQPIAHCAPAGVVHVIARHRLYEQPPRPLGIRSSFWQRWTPTFVGMTLVVTGAWIAISTGRRVIAFRGR